MGKGRESTKEKEAKGEEIKVLFKNLEGGAEQTVVEKPQRDRLLKTRLKKSTTTRFTTASIVKAKK